MMQAMWNRARDRRAGDDGFTLVELLVVIVIIGILVAIAIPVFLSQRQKGWASAAQSDLRNASPVAETYYADNGTYVGLTTADMNTTDGVVLALGTLTTAGYCLEATHTKLPAVLDIWSISTANGTVTKVACP